MIRLNGFPCADCICAQIHLLEYRRGLPGQSKDLTPFAMKTLPIILVSSMLCASYGYAGSDKNVTPVSAVSSQRAQILKKLNAAALSDKSEDRQALEAFGYKLRKDIKDLKVDAELLKAARDKSLDWKTRFLLLERVESSGKKKITKDEELNLYSDVLLDSGEHNEVRKRAAQALMEPSRTEPKARKALEKAAKDKNLPADVLWSVMVSVGSSGIDDVDTLAGLMKRKPKTYNEIGINLNALRALGKSKDPRAVGMLFEILDRSQPDSFFNVEALEQLARMNKDSEKQKKLRPMLVPRLLKLLDDRSRIGASRQVAARTLMRMNERKAIPRILNWVKPKEEGGGGDIGDIGWAFDILAEFNAKEVIPELQKAIDNVPNDPRWAELKMIIERDGRKYPDDAPQYKCLQECLKKLKGEPYNKKYVALPNEYY